MTKQEIVDLVAEATGLTKVETETVMNGIMGTIIDSLADNERVELRGFGTFGIKHRMPKKARNPGTGEPVYLPERFVPTFKPSKLMRSRVNDLINNSYLKFKPNDGMEVRLFGLVTVYEKRGQVQLKVSIMEPLGLGDLYKSFELLKKSLNEEGLFLEKHKEKIPS